MLQPSSVVDTANATASSKGVTKRATLTTTSTSDNPSDTAANSVVMSASQFYELLKDGQIGHCYTQAMRLSHLPPTSERNPYEFKYQARDIWNNILRDLTALRISFDDEDLSRDLKIAVAVIQCHLGANYVAAEEMSDGFTLLEKSHLSLAPYLTEVYPERSDVADVIIELLNQLAVIWSSRSEPQKALELLNESARYFKKARSVKKSAQCLFPPLVNNHADWLERLEMAHTHTLYFQAQTCGQLDQPESAAKLFNETLRRQLKYGPAVGRAWVSDIISLSQFYMTLDMHADAHSCLCKIPFSMGLISSTLTTLAAAESKIRAEVERPEDISMLRSKLAHQWGRLYLKLLHVSSLVQGGSQPSPGFLEKQHYKEPFLTGDNLDETAFPFPTSLPRSFAEASQLFLLSLKKLQQASEYFVLDGFVSENVAINQDISLLYKHLATFEVDPQRIIKLLKRRVDLLSPIFQSLSQDHFVSLRQQLAFEIGEIEFERIALLGESTAKLRRWNGYPESSGSKEQGDWTSLTPLDIRDFNSIVWNGIMHYEHFVGTLLNKSPPRHWDATHVCEIYIDVAVDEFPTAFEEEIVTTVMEVYFALGRLYGKVIPTDVIQDAKLTTRGLNMYETILRYHDQHGVRTYREDTEIAAIKEVCSLLRQKLDKL